MTEEKPTRYQATKTKIEQTFLGLLQNQPLSEISVADITKACDINRNTFYYHYHNIADLLESVVKGLVDEVLKNYPPSYDSLEDCFLASIHLAKDNKKVINNVYHSTRRAIFERHLWHIIDYSVTEFITSLPKTESTPDVIELLMIKDVLKFECFGFAIDWINHDMPDDVEKKIHILMKFMLERNQNL